VFNIHSETGQHGSVVLANDTGVAANTDLIGSLRDRTANINDFGGITRDCGSKGSVGGDRGGCATGTTCGASVLACITSSSLMD
jgi:hypothetical protein